MYTSKNFQIRDEETFSLCIPTDRDYKILQLTDLHLGFGMFSGKKDRLALAAVTELIRRTGPDLIVLTGDSVFPFFPKSGTMNNRKQAQKLLTFLDGFQIPYTFVFGNHDCEMGSTCNKEQLAEIFATGKYAVFTKGRYEHSPQNPIAGVGNFVLEKAGFSCHSSTWTLTCTATAGFSAVSTASMRIRRTGACRS